MPRRNLLVFTMIATGLSVFVAAGLLLALDVYLHHRYADVAGLNRRGYRGAVLPNKRAGERRVAVLGGSTAFGYGVRPAESFPALLERRLNDSAAPPPAAIHVANLAYNNEGAYSFRFTLEDYATLGVDAVVFYEGYNDLDPTPNRRVFRRSSPVFRLIGYLPIFPLVFEEKAMALRYGGNLEAAYDERKTVFRPTLAQRVTASGLEATARVSRALERQVGRLTEAPLPPIDDGAVACSPRWHDYCQWVASAVDDALAHRIKVMVVTQPYCSDLHRAQQRELAGMLRRRFGDRPDAVYLNLGQGVVDLKDPAICFDGAHLTAAGNALIAERLVEPVRSLIHSPARTVDSQPRPEPLS